MTRIWRNTMIMLVILVSTMSSSGFGQITLSEDGQTAYRIVIPRYTDRSTVAVALDFAALLRECTGAVYPVCFDIVPAQDHEIIVGANNTRLTALGLEGLGSDFSPEEYEVRTAGTRLVIVGGAGRGDINGMYGLLQDYLGCRWLTPGCQHVPRQPTVELAEIQDRQKPAFRYRSIDNPMMWDANWYVRNRFNESKAWCGGARPSAVMLLEEDLRAATMANSWNPHALQEVPAEAYRAHPEWRAEINGERVCDDNPVRWAFCMTNDDFAHWVAQWTLEKLRNSPKRQFVSMTNADNGTACECQACRDSNERLGISGTYIEFVNKIAREVAAEFPDTEIVTLVYHHTFAPCPVKAHQNVLAIWAPISADYAYAIDDGPVNRARGYAGQLAHWLEHTDQLGIWYYQFNLDSMVPRPALLATQRSLKLFRDMGVNQLFVEMAFHHSLKNTLGTDGDKDVPAYPIVGDYYTRNRDYGSMVFPYGLEHLRAYIYARLMWQPDFDVAAGIREFCGIYYGPAGKDVSEAAVLCEQIDNYDKERSVGNDFSTYPGIHMDLGHAPRLKLPVLQNCSQLMARGRARVQHDATLLRRVEMATMAIDLALVAHEDTETGLRRAALERFCGLAEEISLASYIRVSGVGNMDLDQLKQHVAGLGN